MSNNPSMLDRIFETAGKLGLGYLDYRIADKQAEASAALHYQQTTGGGHANSNATYGLGGARFTSIDLPNWVLPAALVGFGAVIVWKAVT